MRKLDINLFLCYIINNGLMSSYPTYEEWKPKSLYLPVSKFSCSYPTYEEWKQIQSEPSFALIEGSYPTYEEWKRLVVWNTWCYT